MQLQLARARVCLQFESLPHQPYVRGLDCQGDMKQLTLSVGGLDVGETAATAGDVLMESLAGQTPPDRPWTTSLAARRLMDDGPAM